MSDMTMADTDKIRSTVNKLETIVNAIRANVKAAQDTMAALDKGWTSDVKNEFFRMVRLDLEAMTEMDEQYTEINTMLMDLANDYDRNEQDVLSSLKSAKRK